MSSLNFHAISAFISSSLAKELILGSYKTTDSPFFSDSEVNTSSGARQTSFIYFIFMLLVIKRPHHNPRLCIIMSIQHIGTEFSQVAAYSQFPDAQN